MFVRKISHADERKVNTAKQLAEVQAKLLSLRHRVWTGIHDGETYNIPLSWGFASYPSRYVVLDQLYLWWDGVTNDIFFLILKTD